MKGGTDPSRLIRLEAHPLLVAGLLAGFFLALFGTYWDDAWHTEKGRDSFLVPPHVVLYLGIALAGGALACWALLSIRAQGIRQTLRTRSLLLALLGVGVTLGAAPIDNGWHLAFGRDAVIWSPPHMLGVVGTLAIAAAMLLELADSGSTWSRGAGVVAGAAVVAASTIPVLEYETDVPQFDVAFYLPVLALGSSVGLGLVRRSLVGTIPATAAAALHAGALIVVALVLLALSMPPPLVPALVIPAAALDWAAHRRLPLGAAAALFALGLVGVYAAYLDFLKEDVFIGPRELALGLPAAFAGTLVGLAATGWKGSQGLRSSRPAAAASLLLLMAYLVPMTFAAKAIAHDPGQGEEVADGELTGTSVGDHARLDVNLAGSRHCSDIEPSRIVARRGGELVTGSLRGVTRCRFAGAVELPDRGRWFVYAEFDHNGQAVEAWLPLHAGDPEQVSGTRSVYIPPASGSSLLKWASGALIYLLVAGLLFATARLYATSSGRPAGH